MLIVDELLPVHYFAKGCGGVEDALVVHHAGDDKALFSGFDGKEDALVVDYAGDGKENDLVVDHAGYGGIEDALVVHHVGCDGKEDTLVVDHAWCGGIYKSLTAVTILFRFEVCQLMKH